MNNKIIIKKEQTEKSQNNENIRKEMSRLKNIHFQIGKAH
jgi:hypothetical protein